MSIATRASGMRDGVPLEKRLRSSSRPRSVSDTDAPPFVIPSELSVAAGGEEGLEEAFRHRLGAVDSHRGFLDIQVWRDTRVSGRYLMVSWWDSRENFLEYMRSADHRASHERIPTGSLAPHAVGVQRYELVAR